MALTRSAMRLLSNRFSTAYQARGYADAMSLTFASPYQVCLMYHKYFLRSSFNEVHLIIFFVIKVLYNNVGVKQVDVPSFSGSFGILPAHVPTLAVLKPGVVTVYEQDGNAKKFFVSSGTVTINEDSTGIFFFL